MPFFIIFVFIPLAEIMVFASIGDEIGLINTLMLALITAIIGGMLVKRQGLQTIFALRESTQRGQMPLSELFDGFCLVIAGATLITPGFITDTVGFLLLVPAVRSAIKAYIRDHTDLTMHGPGPSTHPTQGPNIIEGEYEQIADDDDQS